MSDDLLHCRQDAGRRRLFNNDSWNGIDFIEVETSQVELCVHFFGVVPDGLTARNVKIEGGRRITGIKVLSVEIERAHDEDLDDCLHVVIDRPGDFSVYKLCLVDIDIERRPRIDPRYACAEFSFKSECPSDLDCADNSDCSAPETPLASDDVNYLAKDYASFRQLLLDRMAFTLPAWRERHVPDLGITLVEIMAYAADHLSYYQDAVATEAYLETARLRTSIRRHLRLIDYSLHEGLNARGLVAVSVSSPVSVEVAQLFFTTTLAMENIATGSHLGAQDMQGLPAGSYEIFLPDAGNHGRSIDFLPGNNEISIHTWGDQECCLEKGATRATLVDPSPLDANHANAAPALRAGDILVFEEVIGPTTGSSTDADPHRRHAVRLTKVDRFRDDLLGVPVLEVQWSEEDSLPFDLCLSVRLPAPDCSIVNDITVARGNIVVVTHGTPASEIIGPVPGSVVSGDCACDGAAIEIAPRAEKFRPALSKAPVLFSDPVPAEGPVASLFARRIEASLPQISLSEVTSGLNWLPVADLTQSSVTERSFTVESDDASSATLRFGDGQRGCMPETGLRFAASYRTGNPVNGNVAAGAISNLGLLTDSLSGVTISVRNPLPTTGGLAPQATDEARAIAPGLIKARRERAITAADYAELATRNPRLQGAAAALYWTGSWREAHVSIDPFKTDEPPAELLAEVLQELSRYRRMGHDLEVTRARYVPLQLEMVACVSQHQPRSAVLAAIRNTLKASRGGFFEPDRLVFGGGIRASAIIGLVMAVEGVETVEITRLSRQGRRDRSALDTGVLPLSPLEIGQLDNDLDFPERGTMKLRLAGGR